MESNLYGRMRAVASGCCVGLCLLVMAAAGERDGKADAQLEDRMLRLQVSLDDAGYKPGVIDGHWGEFTRKALVLYQASRGVTGAQFGEQPPEEAQIGELLEKEPLTDYQITQADEANVGPQAEGPEEQSKLKALQYGSVIEAVAERFHAHTELLKRLNPNAQWKAGETVRVPNVANRFDLERLRELKKETGSKKGSKGKRDGSDSNREGAVENPLLIDVDTTEKLLTLKEGEQVLGVYPITPGSERLPAPKGEWTMKKTTWLPPFRYDKQMLSKGKRSDEAFELPPGPNSPVGVLWAALSKDGIGIHGTSEPETIGRSVSHGCIRLANWDAFEVGKKLRPGVKVIIR